MKCCDNCKFFIDEYHAEETYCNWWDTIISLPTDECVCTKWVYVGDSGDGDPTDRLCNRCGHEVSRESEVEGYPYYCPECDENLYEMETHEKEK